MTARSPRRRPTRSERARTDVRKGSPPIPESPPGLEFVERRSLMSTRFSSTIALAPGDRAMTEPGARFEPGAVLAEVHRDGRTIEAPRRTGSGTDDAPRPGDRWTGPLPGRGRRGRGSEPGSSEALYALDGRWRLAGGDVTDRIEAPIAGTTLEVRPGISVTVQPAGRALPGVAAFGAPVRGRLEIAAPADGEIRAGAIDVRQRGTILVVGARVDAETLTRARASGVHGVVVAALAGKERRDLLASGQRQQAGRHRLEPFAILVLDGTLRRPIPSALMDILQALAGSEVGILMDPPALVVDDDSIQLPAPPVDAIRVRSGPRAGEEGRWAGLAGLQRFAGGVHLDAGRITLSDGTTAIVPLADLERFG